MIVGTGIDLIEIERIKEASKNCAFLDRVFTESEKAFIKSKNNNPQSIAGLFAAKEAVSKAVGLGIGDLAWHDIEISHDDNGSPFIQLSLNARNIIFLKFGQLRLHVSITHSRTDAAAFAIAEKADETI